MAKVAVSTGYIGTSSGRPDGLYYDEVNERDIIDLRNSSHKVQDYDRLLEREFNKAVAGEVRGEECELEVVSAIENASDDNIYFYNTDEVAIYTNGQVSLFSVGDTVQVGFNNGTNYLNMRGTVKTIGSDYIMLKGNLVTDITVAGAYTGITLVGAKTTRKKSNTTLHCDIIGDPANYYRGQTYTNLGATQSITTVIGDTVWNKVTADYTTDGSTQTVTTAIGDLVYVEVLGSATGTAGMVYRALTVQASIDLNLEDFTSATNWADIGMQGYFYEAVTVQASIDLSQEDYTSTTNWTDLGSDWDGAGSWRTGVSGTPLLVGENGEDYLPSGAGQNIKLSKKYSSWKLGLYSTDNGATWTVWNPTLNATGNNLVDVVPSSWIFMGFYETHTNMTENAVNSEVLALGDVWAGAYYAIAFGERVVESLINKIPKSTRRFYVGSTLYNADNEFRTLHAIYVPIHNAVAPYLLPTDTASAKVLPYITKENNKAYLNLVFKEMKHDVDWGDDSKFNIVDNVSTTTDDNANVVLIGQKRIELPYFIEDKE